MPLSGAPRTLKAVPEPCGGHGKADRTSEIFISYRREDAPAHAGRLYDGLVDEFGAHQVFMDVDTLEPGVDFVERLHAAVDTADAVLVVIGRGWLNAKNLDGERRLDDPEDFVRLEIGLALRGDPVVIPVLVGGATMPHEDELPPDLAVLSRRNALTLIDADWRSGMGRLVAALKRIVDPVAEPEPEPTLVRNNEAVTVREERAETEVPPAAVPLVATALALAGAAGLVIGTFMQLDFWAHPTAANPGGLGYFSSLAPMGLLVGAVGSLALSYTRSGGRIGTGLFLGFALAGSARYVSLLGIWNDPNEGRPSWSRGAGLALVGCLLLVAAGVWRLLADKDAPAGRLGGLTVALVVAGAVLVLVGTVIPFNEGPRPTSTGQTAIIDRSGGWWAVETIGAAALAVGAALLLGRRRAAASGTLVGIGTFLMLLFAGRYIGYPAWQPNTVSDVAWGGFVGLAGGAAVLAGGLVALPRSGAVG